MGTNVSCLKTFILKNMKKTVLLDKIGSVTKNVSFKKRVKLTDNIPPKEGTVIVAEVLEDKKIYNKLELPSGRLATLHKGDIVALALGNRRALQGFVGEVPKRVNVGDVIHILNMGGVAGICVSENLKEVGHAFQVKVLGAVAHGRMSRNIKECHLFKPKQKFQAMTPLIVVSGTCMNVGKTTAACEIIKYASRLGLKISGTKLAGVALLRDTENMKDHGAYDAVSFLDAGFTSTVKQNGKSVHISKGAINYLAKRKPDYIVVEFGDGVFGEYGVMDILKDPEIQRNIVAHVGCAHDPVGAIKLVEICEHVGAPLHVLSGPVTDNSVGVDFLKKKIDIPGFNAFSHGEELFTFLHTTCLKK